MEQFVETNMDAGIGCLAATVPSISQYYFEQNRDYALRITNIHLEDAVKILQKKTLTFVIGQEGNYQDTPLHIHAVFRPWVEDKKKLRSDIKEMFNVTPQEYSLGKLRKSGCRAVRYVIKRGDPHYYYYTDTVDEKKFEVSKCMAHGKGRKSFAKDYEELKEMFYRKSIGRYQFYEKVYELKKNYNQATYPQHIKAMCITVFMRRDKRYFHDFVDHQWENSGLMTLSEQREWNEKHYG